MLRWDWIALRRSESIASAIARPDGPQAIDEAEIELFVLSNFLPVDVQMIRTGKSNCSEGVLFAPS
jgi:hypothetical protein